MAPSTELRLKHLAQSSKLLSLSSPTTAAHLSSTASNLLRYSTNQLSPHLISQCRACGSVETSLRTKWPGQNQRSTNSKLNVKAKLPRNQGRCLVSRCLTCQRMTRQVFDGPKKVQNNPCTAVSARVQAPEQSITKPEPQSSGKKRAKARKDRSDLQALLEKNKESSEPSAGFNLMDFMRSS